MDGLVVDGVFVAGRSCNAKWGTQSPTKLATLHPEFRISPHYDLGKYLYWTELTKRGKMVAAELGLESNPYPKPAPKVTPATRPAFQSGEDGSTPISALIDGEV
jgi:hypothetical protein